VSQNLIWKRRLGNMWAKLPVDRNTIRNVILLYHSVGGGSVSTIREKFETQMNWLAENTVVSSLDSLLRFKERANDKLLVTLTFDDGYRSLHDIAAPILARYGFPATVYLNSSHIGDSDNEASDVIKGHYPGEQFMTWDEVHHLREQGWMIGSHGVEHLDVTTLTAVDMEHQLNFSKKTIEQRLGSECHHFSYTWGRYNQRIEMAVKNAGYRYAVAGKHAPVTKASNLLALPRLDVRREYDLNDFIAVVTGRWDFLGHLQRMRR